MNVSESDGDVYDECQCIPNARTEDDIVGDNDRRAAHAHHRRQARGVEHNVEDRLEQRRVEVGEVLAETLNVDRHAERRAGERRGRKKTG